jgi:hypothetical protein
MKNTLITTLVAIVLFVAISEANAQTASSSDSIAGSWRVTVTSDTFPEPFRALLTFDGEGAVLGSAQGDVLLAPPPGVAPVATAVHGAWVRTGNRQFLFTMRQIFYESDGSYAGGAKVRNNAVMSKSGNEMTGQLVVNYYDSNDNQVFTGTGSYTAQRITAEPLTP